MLLKFCDIFAHSPACQMPQEPGLSLLCSTISACVTVHSNQVIPLTSIQQYGTAFIGSRPFYCKCAVHPFCAGIPAAVHRRLLPRGQHRDVVCLFPIRIPWLIGSGAAPTQESLGKFGAILNFACKSALNILPPTPQKSIFKSISLQGQSIGSLSVHTLVTEQLSKQGRTKRM